VAQRLLSIYLNDHLAEATAEVELARRTRRANEGSELGARLARLCGEVESDRDTLVSVMKELDVRRDRAKVAAGWLAEKAGRLKLNGRLTGYSPLSRVLELGGLQLTASSRLGLWQVLDQVLGERLARFDLPALIERADAQRTDLEGWRLDAGVAALKRG
jgi:hypothetical protein